VEFALVVPLLLLLLLGIIEIGFNLYNAQSLRQGTSTAARNAAVLSSPPASCSTAASGLTADVVCDVKTRTGFDNAEVTIRVPNGWTRGESVVVCSKRPNDSLTGFFPFLDNGEVTSRTEYRIEREGDGDVPTDFNVGGNSWC